MEEPIEVQETGVTAPVAGEQVETGSTEQVDASPNTETGVTPDVAGQETGEKPNNGQAIKAELARREAQMQKKLEEQYGTYQKNLERTAKYNGFDSVDAYVKALDDAERQREIQAEAERLGVDESVVLEHLQPLREKVEQLTQTEKKYQEMQQQLELQKELVELRSKHADFDQYAGKIVEIVESKGYSLEDAYILASYQEKLGRVEKETEAKTIRSLQENASSTPGSLGAEGPDESSGYMAMTPTQRREIRERVKRGEQVNI